MSVYAVTFEAREHATEYLSQQALPFPLLLDPQRVAYRAFGLSHGSTATVWGLGTLWYYGRGLLRGRLPDSSRGRDRHQLGGDVLLRAGGAGGWVYRSDSPIDRPAVDALLRKIMLDEHLARGDVTCLR